MRTKMSGTIALLLPCLVAASAQSVSLRNTPVRRKGLSRKLQQVNSESSIANIETVVTVNIEDGETTYGSETTAGVEHTIVEVSASSECGDGSRNPCEQSMPTIVEMPLQISETTTGPTMSPTGKPTKSSVVFVELPTPPRMSEQESGTEEDGTYLEYVDPPEDTEDTAPGYNPYPPPATGALPTEPYEGELPDNYFPPPTKMPTSKPTKKPTPKPTPMPGKPIPWSGSGYHPSYYKPGWGWGAWGDSWNSGDWGGSGWGGSGWDGGVDDIGWAPLTPKQSGKSGKSKSGKSKSGKHKSSKSSKSGKGAKALDKNRYNNYGSGGSVHQVSQMEYADYYVANSGSYCVVSNCARGLFVGAFVVGVNAFLM